MDLGKVAYRSSPLNVVEGSSDRTTFNTAYADIKIPVPLKDSSNLIFGIGYQQYSFLTKSGSSVSRLDFTSLGIQGGIEKKWHPKFKTLFLLAARLNTDFYEVESDHLQFGFLFQNMHHRTKTFAFKYGLYFNTEFFGPMFVPLLGFNWQINKKLYFQITAPINFELAYRPKKWWATGFRFDGVNGSFRIKPGVDPTKNRYVDKADINLWAYTEFNTFGNFWLHLRGGPSIIRTYRIYNKDERELTKIGPIHIGDDRPETLSLFKDGVSLEVGLIYRFPLD